MKQEKLNTQYNSISQTYDLLRKDFNEISDTSFRNILDPLIIGITSAIDFACGNGDMILYLQSRGITCAGVDSSSEMVALAKAHTSANIRCEDFAHTSFKGELFDLVTSKWAMQTSPDINPIYKEAARLLKQSGYFVFLVVHPLRQFLEKKKHGKDYFEKQIVESIIFDGAITVQEPSHTLKEYLSNFFFKNFTLLSINEGAEFPAAEQIGGDIYPTYLIITAQKK